MSGLGTVASRGHRLAALFTFGFELMLARVELAQHVKAPIQFRGCASKRIRRRALLLRNIRRLFIQPLSAKDGFLRFCTGGFELAEKLGVAPMGCLDARLRVIALGFGVYEGFADCSELRLYLCHTLLGDGDCRSQTLQAVLALDDTGMLVGTSTDTQPVLTNPFAGSGNDRLAGRQRATCEQCVRQGLRSEHTNQR